MDEGVAFYLQDDSRIGPSWKTQIYAPDGGFSEDVDPNFGLAPDAAEASCERKIVLIRRELDDAPLEARIVGSVSIDGSFHESELDVEKLAGLVKSEDKVDFKVVFRRRR